VSSSIAGRHAEAEALFREALAAQEERGDRSATARTIAGLAGSFLDSYRAHAAVALVEPQTERFADMPDDPGVIAMNGQLARAYFFLEDYRRSQQVAEGVLEAAERLELLPTIGETLVTRGMGHSQLGRMYEGLGALEAGLRLAEAKGFNAT